MSTDPKKDLLRKSGPLGTNSPVAQEAVEKATEPQAAIMYQNDQQLAVVYRLEGKVDTGFQNIKEWIGSIDSRLVVVEDFRKSIMVLPKAIWGLAGVIGLDGILKLWHLVSGH